MVLQDLASHFVRFVQEVLTFKSRGRLIFIFFFRKNQAINFYFFNFVVLSNSKVLKISGPGNKNSYHQRSDLLPGKKSL